MYEEDESPPPLAVRWMRPQTASAILELPTAPITTVQQKEIGWQAFSAEESKQCEAAWQKLSEEDRRRAEGDENDESAQQRTSDDIDDEKEDIVGVSIAKDKLFEVDVRSMRLRPIYWKMNAPPIRVFRGTWFYDDHRPVPNADARRLEELYLRLKPWLSSYQLELTTALDLGPEAHAKLKQNIDEARNVVFENSTKAYFVSNYASRRFFSFFPGSSSTAQPTTLTYYPNAITVYRGYDAALSVHERPKSPLNADTVPTKRKASFDDAKRSTSGIATSPEEEEHDVKVADEEDQRGRMGRSPQSPPPVGNEGSEEVTDLVLIVHGIGQGLATEYEGFNFVYAANLFRHVARKQSMTPALSSIMRNRRVQFLPVQWRTNFQPDADEERRREDAGLDNEFTLNDITIKNSVPYIRDLMNKVLIDIPYFMSRHKDRMIRAVANQANRIYRLWCARNPEFETRGRVHLVAHSLGASLAGHILSHQPTVQPALSEMEPDYLKKCQDLFLFNTSCIFMLGSPFPLFVHINRTQVIARKGRERTKNSPPDEAYDKVGLFGCLAADSVYNIFNPSDPIAYLLNPCVDARKAKDLPPSVIKNVNTPLFTSFSTRMTRMFEGVISTTPKSRSPSRPPLSHKVTSGFELGGPSETIDGTIEERRFLALNPRGTLDFALPSEGNLSSYFDMITAHSAYWADPNLAAFLLAEIFARKEDLERTGLGVEPPSSPSK